MKLDVNFKAKIEKYDSKGGWHYVVWPESTQYFDTKGLVKVRGTIEGEPFMTSFMAMGDGRQMLPIKTALRNKINKQLGDTVTIKLLERL